MLEQPCPTCGYELDINDDVCPQCGQARRRRREPHASGSVAAAGIGGSMLVGGVLGWLIGVTGVMANDGAGSFAISVFTLVGIFFGLLVGIYLYRRYARLR